MELESEFDAQNTIFLRTSISFSNNTIYENTSISRSNGTISPPGKLKFAKLCELYMIHFVCVSLITLTVNEILLIQFL